MRPTPAATGAAGGAGGTALYASDEAVPLVCTVVGAGGGKPLTEAASPGPIYLPRHTLTEPTAARVLFNGAPRYPSSKHSDAGPGPGAYAIPAPSGPAPTMRGREAFGSATFGTFMDVPGPGEYPRVETRQTTKTNPPKYSLKSRRLIKPPAFSVPAPNAHQKPEPTVKFQYVAKLTNAPRVVFGPPPRKRELSKEAAAVFSTPGPSEYGVDAAYKHMSTLPATPAFTMVPRRPMPGVGDRAGGYNIVPNFHNPIEGVGKQALSTKKTAPAPSFSGRVKFGSPYFA